jgi:hypothetical protein
MDEAEEEDRQEDTVLILLDECEEYLSLCCPAEFP